MKTGLKERKKKRYKSATGTVIRFTCLALHVSFFQNNYLIHYYYMRFFDKKSIIFITFYRMSVFSRYLIYK